MKRSYRSNPWRGISNRRLKRLEANPEAEQSFTQDLFRLLGDAESFDWPVDDLGRCLALAVFPEHTKELLDAV